MSRTREPIDSRDTRAGKQAQPSASSRRLSGLSKRQRFTAIASVAYILLGAIIIVRSILADVQPLAVLGAVFIALGVVKLRDFWKWSRTRDVR
jgi:hypothetical protein